MKVTDLDWLIGLVPDAAIVVGQDQVILAANPRADALFGAPAGGLKTQALELLIPEASRTDHRQHVEGFFNTEQCRSMGTGLRFQGRRLDGQPQPLDIMLNRICVGERVLTIAVIRDDSERAAIRKVRDELAATNARLFRAQELGGLGWWELDRNTEQLSWSQMVPRMLGLAEGVAPALELVVEQCHPDDRSQLLAFHQILEKDPGKKLTYRICRSDGEVRWIVEKIDLGVGNRVLGVMRDITTEKVLEERLRKESVIDELTGLYNRKQFNRDLKSRYSEYSRRDQSASLIMYDFDYFKNINDCHGHLVGDKVLSQSAQIVLNELRPMDHAYRLGGEEFAIIVRDAEFVDVQKVAERIRGAIEQARFRSDDSLVRATVSLGVSRFRASDTHFEDMLRRADEALYRSKSKSRNTTSIIE